MQKLPSFEDKKVALSELSNFFGAFHLKSPIGGFAYGMSSQFTTLFFTYPIEIPDVVRISYSLEKVLTENKRMNANSRKGIVIVINYKLRI